MSNEISEDSRLERADALGLATARTLIVLHSGAMLAMLTYIGGNSRESAIAIQTEAIISAITYFSVGTALVLIALALSYSYTASAPGQKWSIFWAEWIIPLNLVVAIGSTALFFSGVHAVVAGIEGR
ncbi:hypothetical protein [Roseobacter sp. HKCCA0434]|uniref:hypothetical protein n=1 Tax=Roseobacter sp. HKCCA0434 TaxID=3079297 RepID=UPI00290581E5|nr:hypothetical protein [Roseobacter sp. HKCCA0434]